MEDENYCPALAGVGRFLQRRAELRMVAAQIAQNEAERKRIFGDGPPGGGDLVAFRHRQGAECGKPMDEGERRRLLSMTQAGKDLLARETKLAAFSKREPKTGEGDRGEAGSGALSREEKDRLLSLTATGRDILLARKARLMKTAGIPTVD